MEQLLSSKLLESPNLPDCPVMELLRGFGNDSYDGDVEDLSSEEGDAERLLAFNKCNQETQASGVIGKVAKKKKGLEYTSSGSKCKLSRNGELKLHSFSPRNGNSSSNETNESIKLKVTNGKKIHVKSSLTRGSRQSTENRTAAEICDIEGSSKSRRSSYSGVSVSDRREGYFLQNPTADPRFQRLISQLVPNKKSKEIAEKRTLGNEKRYMPQ
jgi:hypothetical protein